MTSALKPGPNHGRLRPGPIAALGLVVAAGAAFALAKRSSSQEAERARARAGEELAAFERCLIGAPLGPGEALADRVRGVELALALARKPPPDPKTEVDDEGRLDAGASADAGPDGGSSRAGDADDVSAAPPWPSRCAPFAAALARTLDGPELAGDARLSPLRDALPTPARLEMRFALRVDEASDLSAAVASAALPRPAIEPAVEPPPPALGAPPRATEIAPLGRGKLRLSTKSLEVALATDALQTSALHVLIPSDAGPTRLCELTEGDPKGPYATARCGDLPKDWRNNVELANVEEGAPLALIASKRAGDAPPESSDAWTHGVVVFAPGGRKVIPSKSSLNPGGVYIAKDGSYMLASTAYLSFVRVGAVAKLKTTDLGQEPLDHDTAQALPPDAPPSIAAYGHVFWNDRPYLYYNQTYERYLNSRKVQPALSAGEITLGEAPSSYLHFRGGCEAGGRRALVFGSDAPGGYGASPSNPGSTGKIVVVIQEGGGALKRLDAEVRETAPHLLCAKDAAILTSVGPTKERDGVIVTQSRCTAAGCEARSSDPIPLRAAAQLDAATTDAGVLLLWRHPDDLVASPARAMAFFRLAPLSALASAPPRALLENKRRGGIDIDAVHVIARGPAAIIAVESGGKSPVTRAVRVDGAGVVSPVTVEDAQW